MNYQLDSFVNKKEAEALKELIFKRARERSKAMTENFQADIMSVARDSFVGNKNPFSQILVQAEEKHAEVNNDKKTEQTEVKVSSLHEYTKDAEVADSIGFPQKNLFAGAANQNRIIKEQITAAQVQNTMMEAHKELSNKKSFMGALEFLNSQAAASLLNKRAGKGLDLVV